MTSFIEYLVNPYFRRAVYFLIGGTATLLTIYLAAMGRGNLAAFIATLPLQTALTFMLIDAEGGDKNVQSYARGLLIFAPPWMCYVATVMLGVGRLGIFRSLALGMLVYVALSYFFRLL